VNGALAGGSKAEDRSFWIWEVSKGTKGIRILSDVVAWIVEDSIPTTALRLNIRTCPNSVGLSVGLKRGLICGFVANLYTN